MAKGKAVLAWDSRVAGWVEVKLRYPAGLGKRMARNDERHLVDYVVGQWDGVTRVRLAIVNEHAHLVGVVFAGADVVGVVRLYAWGWGQVS